MAKQHTYATKRTNGRKTPAGSLRMRDIERKVRKPPVKPSRTFRSKKAYQRADRKKEERRALLDT